MHQLGSSTLQRFSRQKLVPQLVISPRIPSSLTFPPSIKFALCYNDNITNNPITGEILLPACTHICKTFVENRYAIAKIDCGFLVPDAKCASGETPRRWNVWRASWKLSCTVVTTPGQWWCVSTSSAITIDGNKSIYLKSGRRNDGYRTKMDGFVPSYFFSSIFS